MFINLYQYLHYSIEKAPVALAQLRVTCPPRHKELSQSCSPFQNNTIQSLAYTEANFWGKNQHVLKHYCKTYLRWSLIGLIFSHDLYPK